MRRNYKKQTRIYQNGNFKLLEAIYVAMDKYCLDPLIGLFIPGFGDILSSVLITPYIFVSLFVVRSIPLTLNLVYHCLIDVLIGMIPILGNVLDFFVRSYKESYEDITNYIDGDEETIEKINGNMLKMCILITIVCFLIRLVAFLVALFIGWVKGWWPW